MSSRSAEVSPPAGPSPIAPGALPPQVVPQDPPQRRLLRAEAAAEANSLRNGKPPTAAILEQAATHLLDRLSLPRQHLGFAMVMIGNAYWMERLRRVPFSRRLLLLPRCLEEIVPAGEACDCHQESGAEINRLERKARQLGYEVLVADGMPAVVKILAQKRIEAVVGVACLDSLQAAFEKVWQLALPAVAVPLLRGQCRETSADLDWLDEFIHARDESLPAGEQNGYLPLLHLAADMFRPARLSELLANVEPEQRDGALGRTAELAREWLVTGGKRLRPFITLAAACAAAETAPEKLSDAALRVALAIEAFHKASLVHDDIEDEDEQRYGRPTLHKQHGVGMAINLGDYLLGLGYRLIAAGPLPAAVTAAILRQMSRAHVGLAQGQGAELTWRREGRLDVSPPEVLKMYSLKTAPAFEAALACGVLLGTGRGDLDEANKIRTLSRHVGVGFQVLNDLEGWREDCRAARATYLTALALRAAENEAGRRELLQRISACQDRPQELQALEARYDQLGVFAQADSLRRRLRDRAAELASQIHPPALAQLCRFLVELILK